MAKTRFPDDAARAGGAIESDGARDSGVPPRNPRRREALRVHGDARRGRGSGQKFTGKSRSAASMRAFVNVM